jgi:hypothetical protein
MAEGIIIPDTEYADAEIWVMTIEKAFHVEETRHLLTVIPFQCDWSDRAKFRSEVFKVADDLEEVYQNYQDYIAIEVKFHNRYVNG